MTYLEHLGLCMQPLFHKSISRTVPRIQTPRGKTTKFLWGLRGGSSCNAISVPHVSCCIHVAVCRNLGVGLLVVGVGDWKVRLFRAQINHMGMSIRPDNRTVTQQNSPSRPDTTIPEPHNRLWCIKWIQPKQIICSTFPKVCEIKIRHAQQKLRRFLLSLLHSLFLWQRIKVWNAALAIRSSLGAPAKKGRASTWSAGTMLHSAHSSKFWTFLYILEKPAYFACSNILVSLSWLIIIITYHVQFSIPIWRGCSSCSLLFSCAVSCPEDCIWMYLVHIPRGHAECLAGCQSSCKAQPPTFRKKW